VHVVEARDRVGGRVRTWRGAALSPGHAEAGGQFIDAEHEAVRARARELGLDLVRVLRSGFGLAIRHEGRLHVHRTQGGVWRDLRRTRHSGRQIWETARDADGLMDRVARIPVPQMLRDAAAPPRLQAAAASLRGSSWVTPTASQRRCCSSDSRTARIPAAWRCIESTVGTIVSLLHWDALSDDG
jgi:monoamine oxidase